MNKTDFIKQLVEKTGLTNEQASEANNIFENTVLVGNKNKELIQNQLCERLGIDEAQADMIYNAAAELVASGVLDKVKSIFK